VGCSAASRCDCEGLRIDRKGKSAKSLFPSAIPRFTGLDPRKRRGHCPNLTADALQWATARNALRHSLHESSQTLPPRLCRGMRSIPDASIPVADPLEARHADATAALDGCCSNVPPDHPRMPSTEVRRRGVGTTLDLSPTRPWVRDAAIRQTPPKERQGPARLVPKAVSPIRDSRQRLACDPPAGTVRYDECDIGISAEGLRNSHRVDAIHVQREPRHQLCLPNVLLPLTRERSERRVSRLVGRSHAKFSQASAGRRRPRDRLNPRRRSRRSCPTLRVKSRSSAGQRSPTSKCASDCSAYAREQEPLLRSHPARAIPRAIARNCAACRLARATVGQADSEPAPGPGTAPLVMRTWPEARRMHLPRRLRRAGSRTGPSCTQVPSNVFAAQARGAATHRLLRLVGQLSFTILQVSHR